jgi:hypothetical protein
MDGEVPVKDFTAEDHQPSAAAKADGNRGQIVFVVRPAAAAGVAEVFVAETERL